MVEPRDRGEGVATSIAVVLPAYNASEYIADAVRSVLVQSRLPDEFVVVDDGSDDDTAARARVDPSVRVVRIEHGGIAVARNAGTAVTTSAWIAYMDADDLWYGEKLEAYEDVVAGGDRSGLVFSNFDRCKLGADEVRPETNTDLFPWLLDSPADRGTAGRRPIHHFREAVAFEAILRGYPVFPSTAMVRRELLEVAGGWDPRARRTQDFDLWLRLVRLAGMTYIDDVLTTVRVRPDHGGPHRWLARQFEWNLRALERHKDSLDFTEAERAMMRRYIGARTIWRGDLSRRYDRRLEALTWYLRAMRHVRQIPRALLRSLQTLLPFD